MGFLDKLKNTFFEEEYIEVDEDEEEESKPIARKVEVNKEEETHNIHFVDEVEPEEEQEDEYVEEEANNSVSLADRDLYKSEAIQYFEDDDFEDTFVQEPVVQEPVKEEPKLYGGEAPKKLYEPEFETEGPYKPYATQPVQTKFKPTPVISPIYGILDKNYKKDEITEKKDRPSSYVSRRNVDLDYVRNKAFGTKIEEEDIMLDSFIDDRNDVVQKEEAKVEEKIESDDNLLVDMNESDCPSVEKVTIADAEEYFEDLGLEYNVDYKDKRYETATGRRTKPAKEEEQNDDASKSTIEVIEELAVGSKEEPVEEESKIDDLIEEAKNFEDPKDNLFDLIDSMYDDNEEEEE